MIAGKHTAQVLVKEVSFLSSCGCSSIPVSQATADGGGSDVFVWPSAVGQYIRSNDEAGCPGSS
jgi:hypothetical protein